MKAIPCSHRRTSGAVRQRSGFNQRWLGTVAGRFRAAEDPWKEELRSRCYDSGQLIIWGLIDLQTKHGDRGRSLFERAVLLASDDPRGYENLGAFLLETGDSAAACEILEKRSRLSGASEQLHVKLCNAYRALRRPAAALRAAGRGVELMPESAELRNALGLALEDAGQPGEAMRAFREALARAPRDPEPLVNLGNVQLRLGRKEEACASFKQALDDQPLFARALELLARLEMEAGHPEAAVQYIRPYYEQYPGSNTARDLMAKWHLLTALNLARTGDTAAAEKACREGLVANPDSAELFLFLGTLCRQQRRNTEAFEALETSRQLEPGDPRMALTLSDLYVQLGRREDARRLLAESEQSARKRGDIRSAGQDGRKTESAVPVKPDFTGIARGLPMLYPICPNSAWKLSMATELGGMLAWAPKRCSNANIVNPARISPMKKSTVQNTLSHRKCMK